jgi:hypothetical protein
MFFFLSVVTSVKDYFEIVHKVLESQGQTISQYNDLGALLTYSLINIKEFFSFFQPGQLLSLPILIPNIASAILSEVSVLDTHFTSPFNFLETNFFNNQHSDIFKNISISETDIATVKINSQNWNSNLLVQEADTSAGIQRNLLVYSLEKFLLGFINSLFIWLPTSVSQLIVLRRFVVQGLEAGYIAGLGTIAGNILWVSSIIFGFRFLIIPWLSLDYLRYIIGFVLILKYLWDTYKERQIIRDRFSLQKIFLLSFLITFTEQSSLYPFLKTMSITPSSTILETFPVTTLAEFICIHGAYVLGLLVGCLSLLHFMCWFWEKPALDIYLKYTQLLSSSRLDLKWKTFLRFVTSFKFINFSFLYLTMLFSMASMTYFGLDYSLTNPLGFVHEDRLFNIPNRQATMLDDFTPIRPLSFLYVRGSDLNTRINSGRQARSERWKKKFEKYRAFDASLYDQAFYDFFSLEDLNYGFDRFWLRRKKRIRNHRFFFFPKLSRKLKRQFRMSSVDSEKAVRSFLFRTLSDEVYHPTFHDFKNKATKNKKSTKQIFPAKVNSSNLNIRFAGKQEEQDVAKQLGYSVISNPSVKEVQAAQTSLLNKSPEIILTNELFRKFSRNFSIRLNNTKNSSFGNPNLNIKDIIKTDKKYLILKSSFAENQTQQAKYPFAAEQKQQDVAKQSVINIQNTKNSSSSISRTQLLYPIKYYIEKEKAFQRKLNYYGVNIYRKFTIEKNAPFFRILMKRLFFYYKPTRRLERTLKLSQIRLRRSKGSRIPRKLIFNENKAQISNVNPSSSIIDHNFVTKENIGEGSDLKSQNSLSELQVNRAAALFTKQSNILLQKGFGYPALNRDLSLKSEQMTYDQLNQNNMTVSNSSYSILGKRASRYRSQIYKDVLLHWYYSPFNRLLLKFDIDLFISRQPKTQFLTNKEEKYLHLKRVLLAEHYDTLRWYNYMQHTQTMKTRIGGTKSFASRIYNQQFAGTFKKIRHLFSITPSLSDENILKYDQPLFNENIKVKAFSSSEQNSDQLNLLQISNKKQNPYLHEEISFFKKAQYLENSDMLNKSFQTSELDNNNKAFQELPAKKSEKISLVWNKLSDRNSESVKTSKLLRKALYNKFLLKKQDEVITKTLNKRLIVNKELKEKISLFLGDPGNKNIVKEKKSKSNIFRRLGLRLRLKVFHFKYFQKREKTLEYWQEKSLFLLTKQNIKKNFDTDGKIRFKEKPQKQNYSKQFKTTKKTNFKNLQQKFKLSLLDKEKLSFLVQNFKNKAEMRRNVVDESREKLILGTLQKASERIESQPTAFYSSFVNSNINLSSTTDGTFQNEELTRQKRDELEQKFYVSNTKPKLTRPREFYQKGLKNEFKTIQRILKKPKILKKGKYQSERKGEFTKFPLRYNDIFLRNRVQPSISEKTKNNILRSKSEESSKGNDEIKDQNFFVKVSNLIWKKIKGIFQKSTDKDERIPTLKKSHTKGIWKKTLSSNTKYKKRKQFLKYLIYQKSAYPNQILKKINLFKKRKITKTKLENWWYKTKQKTFSIKQNYLDQTSSLPLSDIHFDPRFMKDEESNGISKKRLWEFEKGRTIEQKKSILSSPDIFERNEKKRLQYSFEEDIQFLNTSNVPYYAGWDESLRKFVVTNRVFSRQNNGEHVFLQGTHALTTLYWKAPFAKYEEEQFFPQGRSAFSPIKWRRLKFRHSLLKNWKKLKNKLSLFEKEQSKTLAFENKDENTILIGTCSFQKLAIPLNEKNCLTNNSKQNISKIAKVHFIQTHYKRLRNDSLRKSKPYKSINGPLLQEVLPIHYITIFSQQNRENRSRYISPRMRVLNKFPKKSKFKKRNRANLIPTESDLIKTKSLSTIERDTMKISENINPEFTLRRRIKTRRKYHKTRQKNIIGKYLPRRKKFIGEINETERWRPFSKERINLKSTQKTVSNTSKIRRIKQLRKRDQRFVINPEISFKPYAGGFLWPGDYLRLIRENIPKLPLEKTNENKVTNLRKKAKEKRVFTNEEFRKYELHPKKYLIERHNLKVLKKKLEKIQRFF